MKVQEILKITKGKLLSGDSTAEIDLATILTDSRNIKTGEFFLPLKGNNFDGEEFIGEAFKKGAVGAFTIRQGARAQACLPRTISAQGLPARLSASASASQGRDGKPRAGVGQEKIIIQVKNTTKALQEIAHEHRIRFDIPVIGVTGSNGKTTVKDMTAKVLSSKYKVLKNEGTKNNHIGLPQTLLKLKKYHEICILEMGTNHKGEIRSLADIARPNIAVITNIGPSHLEGLKTLEAILLEKAKLFYHLEKNGTILFKCHLEIAVNAAFMESVKRAMLDALKLVHDASFKEEDIKARFDALKPGESRLKSRCVRFSTCRCSLTEPLSGW